jgi:hypothetical protein
MDNYLDLVRSKSDRRGQTHQYLDFFLAGLKLPRVLVLVVTWYRGSHLAVNKCVIMSNHHFHQKISCDKTCFGPSCRPASAPSAGPFRRPAWAQYKYSISPSRSQHFHHEQRDLQSAAQALPCEIIQTSPRTAAQRRCRSGSGLPSGRPSDVEEKATGRG